MLKPVAKAPPFLIELSPSRLCTCYLLAVYAALLTSLPYWPLATVAKSVLAVLLLSSFFYLHRHYNHGGHPGWIARCGHGARGLWVEAGGERREVAVVHATVWQWLVVVNLVDTGSGRRLRLCVWPDSCSPQQRRRLRVLLRHCLASGG